MNYDLQLLEATYTSHLLLFDSIKLLIKHLIKWINQIFCCYVCIMCKSKQKCVCVQDWQN